jgi:translation initiation factor IF-1
MVKNKTGGKRSKGLARKQQTNDPSTEQLHRGNIRTKEDAIKETKGLPGTYFYAKVTKSYGNCRFAALCDDGVERIASCMHFAKKNRRDNNVEVGSNLLVGVADYHATASGKLQQSQILELYTPAEAACIPYVQEDEEDDDLVAQEVDTAMAEEVAVGDFDDI